MLLSIPAELLHLIFEHCDDLTKCLTSLVAGGSPSITQKSLMKCLARECREGFPMVEYAKKSFELEALGYYAAAAGNVNLIKYLESLGRRPWSKKGFAKAATKGHLDVLKLYCKKIKNYASLYEKGVLKSGNVKVLEWWIDMMLDDSRIFMKTKISYQKALLYAASKNISFYKLVHEKWRTMTLWFIPDMKTDIATIAINSGNVEILRHNDNELLKICDGEHLVQAMLLKQHKCARAILDYHGGDL